MSLNDMQIREDGFINASQLCREGKKKFNNWYKLVSTQDMVSQIEKEYDCIAVYRTKDRYPVAWIHPKLLDHLIKWLGIQPETDLKEINYRLIEHDKTNETINELKMIIYNRERIFAEQIKNINEKIMNIFIWLIILLINLILLDIICVRLY